MKRSIFAIAVACAGAALVAAPVAPVLAAERAESSSTITSNVATVTVNNRPVMQLASAGEMSAEERAELVEQRLHSLLSPDPRAAFRPVSANEVKVVQRNGQPQVMVRDRALITVTQADARSLGKQTPQAVAQRFANDLRQALVGYRLAEGQALPEDFIMVATGPISDQASSSRRAAAAPKPARAADKPVAAVRVNNREVMQLAEVGGMTAEQRAAMVRERVEGTVRPQPNEAFEVIQASDLEVVTVSNIPVLRLREQNIISVTQADADLAGMTPQALAQRWANDLRGALTSFRLGENQAIPENFIVVRVLDPRTGGGAGQAPKKPEQSKPKAPHSGDKGTH